MKTPNMLIAAKFPVEYGFTVDQVREFTSRFVCELVDRMNQCGLPAEYRGVVMVDERDGTIWSHVFDSIDIIHH